MIAESSVGREPEELRDAAEYNEASCDPAEIQDSIEDLLREAAHPVKLTDQNIARILAVLSLAQSREPVASESIPVTLDQRAQMLGEFLAEFNPQEWTLLNWWAIQFAIHSKNTEDISPAQLSRTTGASRQLFNWHVGKWRKRLNLPVVNDLKRESIRLSWRDRKRTNNVSKKYCKVPLLHMAGWSIDKLARHFKVHKSTMYEVMQSMGIDTGRKVQERKKSV